MSAKIPSKFSWLFLTISFVYQKSQEKGNTETKGDATEHLISPHNLTSPSGKSTFRPEVREHCLWTRSSSQQSCWVDRGNLAQSTVRETRERHYSLLQTRSCQKSVTKVGQLQTKAEFWSHSNALTFKLLHTNGNREPTSIKKGREIRCRSHYQCSQIQCLSNDAGTVTNFRLVEWSKIIVVHVRYAL